MQPYHLVKLVEWSSEGKLKSRKRLQKVVYLLQSAGCDTMNADFILHHYGPYSADVAEITDRMVAAGCLLEEKPPDPRQAVPYAYSLSDSGKKSLQAYENTPPGKRLAELVCRFERHARYLLSQDLRNLEYAATIAYFHDTGADWEQAVSRTSRFKCAGVDDPAMKAALELAKKAMAS